MGQKNRLSSQLRVWTFNRFYRLLILSFYKGEKKNPSHFNFKDVPFLKMCKSGSAFCSLQKHASSKAMSLTHCQQKLLMLWPHYTTLGVIRALPCCYTTQLSVLYWEFYHCCSFNATWLISNRHDKINKARHCIRMTPPEQLQLFIRWFAALIISWISKEDTVTCRKAFACVFCQKNKQYCIATTSHRAGSQWRAFFWFLKT